MGIVFEYDLFNCMRDVACGLITVAEGQIYAAAHIYLLLAPVTRILPPISID